MTDKQTTGSSGYLVFAVLFLVLLPVLYVLSVGPVACVMVNSGFEHDHWAMQAAETFYAPVIFLVENSETFEACYVWYLSFWIDVSGP